MFNSSNFDLGSGPPKPVEGNPVSSVQTSVPWVPGYALGTIPPNQLLLTLGKKTAASSPIIVTKAISVQGSAASGGGISSMSVTESPVKQQDRTFSLVSVSFFRDPSDTTFAGVRIWFIGYKGSANPVLMTSATDSPVSFLAESTKETVMVVLQRYSTDGSMQDFNLCPSAPLTLDGVVSPPPAPTISQPLVAIPLGYQFAFNQLSGLLSDVIDSYRVYRNPVNNPTTAALYNTIKHDPTNLGSVVVQDTTGGGQTLYYWVSAVNTSGLESSKTAAQSSAVTSGTANLDTDVNDGSNFGRSLIQSVNLVPDSELKHVSLYWPVRSGSFSVVSSPSASGGAAGQAWQSPAGTGLPSGATYVRSVPFPVTAGKTYTLSAWIDASHVTSGSPFVAVEDAELSTGYGAASQTAGQSGRITATFTIPTGVTSAVLLAHTNDCVIASGQFLYFSGFQVVLGSNAGVYTPSVLDQLSGTPLVDLSNSNHLNKNLDNIGDGPIFKRLSNVASDNTLHVSTPINNQGSILSAGDNAFFSYSSTTTSISIWNTAFSIPRPDGTNVSIPANGSSGSPAWTFTGLHPSTNYHFGAYYNMGSGTVQVVQSNNVTLPGTIAWVVQTLSADGRIPLFTDWAILTPASGTGGGGGSPGGGGGTCPAEDQLIETRELGFIPAIELRPGLHVRGWHDEWNAVESAEAIEGWLHRVVAGGEEYRVDLNHRWLPEGTAPDAPQEEWRLSSELASGDVLQAADGSLAVVESVSPAYWGRYVKIRAANQRFKIGKLIAHNYATLPGL